MKKEKWIIVIVIVGLAIFISGCDLRLEKELYFEDDAQILCYIPKYIIYGIPVQEENKSYSLYIKK